MMKRRISSVVCFVLLPFSSTMVQAGDLQGGGGGREVVEDVVQIMNEVNKVPSLTIDRVVDRQGNIFALSKSNVLYRVEKGPFEGGGGPHSVDFVIEYESAAKDEAGQSILYKFLGNKKNDVAQGANEIQNALIQNNPMLNDLMNNYVPIETGELSDACLVALYPPDCTCSSEMGWPKITCNPTVSLAAHDAGGGGKKEAEPAINMPKNSNGPDLRRVHPALPTQLPAIPPFGGRLGGSVTDSGVIKCTLLDNKTACVTQKRP